MRRKHKKEILIEDDDRFEIYQIYSSFALTSYSRKFIPSQVCSPLYGTKVTNKSSFRDNKGSIDIDYGYDFIRRKEDRHISDEELERRHGSKYYEFNILNNKKIQEIYGNDGSDVDNTKVIQEEIKYKQPIDSFISSIDELGIDETSNTNEEKIESKEETIPENIFEENKEFKLNIDEDYEYNSYPKEEPVNIPSFLTKNDNNNDLDEINEEKTEEDTPIEETITFDNIPSMSAPTINFDSNADYFNPAVDRTLTVEEARRKYNESKNDGGLGATVSPNAKSEPKKIEEKIESKDEKIDRYLKIGRASCRERV